LTGQAEMQNALQIRKILQPGQLVMEQETFAKYQAAILVMQSFQKPMELQTFAIQEGIVLPFSSLSSHHNEMKKR